MVLTLSSVLHHPVVTDKKFEDPVTVSQFTARRSKSSRLRTFSGEIVKMRADYINPVNPKITPIVVNKYRVQS